MRKNESQSLTINIMHVAASATQKMNCKFENTATLENLLNKVLHAWYSKRSQQLVYE
jgi:hypothetical protein